MEVRNCFITASFLTFLKVLIVVVEHSSIEFSVSSDQIVLVFIGL